MREAIHSIAISSEADRIGVWIDTESSVDTGPRGSFRGIVWDRDATETPAEWRQLSAEAPLPRELLTSGGTAEIDLEASPEFLILGPLLELRRALWVPIQAHGQLRGLILAGAKRKAALLSRQVVELAAAELALALEREKEQRNAQDRQADLAVTRHTLQSLAAGAAPETALKKLAESCVKTAGSPDAPGAVFAAIGRLESGSAASEAMSTAALGLRFLWSAGDGSAHALQSGPLHGAWCAALEARRVVGAEIQAASAQSSATRAVAIPLESDGDLLGVLVAAFPATAASLATLERLELRASLAATALARIKDLEEQARQIAAQRAALLASAQPALLLDVQGFVLEISRAALDLFGESATPLVPPSPENIDRPFVHLFQLSDQNRAAAWLEAQLASRTSGSVPPAQALEAELKNGQRVRMHPFVPAGNASIILLLERSRLGESALSLENAGIELRNVIEWLEEGVVLFDAQDHVRAMNMRFEQMAGLSSEESGAYQTLAALIARLEPQAADPPAFAERWRSLARGIDGGIREELQMVQPVPRVLERSARPILDGAGRLLGRVEIYRDLTAQRVFQSKLLQTEKLAALGQMLTGVAHELSNPLTTVLGYAQRLLTRKDAAGRSEEARQIHQEAERASRILRQLLSHARETPPERRSLSLNQVILRTMELQRFALAAEKVHVELDLDPVLPSVRGDSGQLQQVLMNLLGNARQAIEQQGKGGTIRVRTRREVYDRVTLYVDDTGPGIPHSIQARVFDPFFTTKPAGVGTGLGLSIVLSIVREHGGNVRVISPPGGGTSFAVDLPAIAEPALSAREPAAAMRAQDASALDPPAAAALATAPLARERAATAAAKRILVVEDEPTVARLIADVLEDEGFAVTVLLDGTEALQRATHEAFDLVICDMKMPGLDGQHFYKSLKRMGSPLANRFLFVTGDTIGPHTHAFLTQYHLAYLSKPFRVEELTEQVWQALNQPSHGARPVVVTKKSAARNG